VNLLSAYDNVARVTESHVETILDIERVKHDIKYLIL